MNRSSNKGRAALSQSCSSGTLENRANSFDDDFICINSGTDETNKSLVRSQSIHSSSSTQTHALSQNNYGQHTKPAGRPPPPKPERQNRVTTGRSGSVDSRRPQKSSPTTTTEKNANSKIDVNNLQLIESTSEIDNEIASLKKRGPSESAAIACRFISPVLDYLITAFSVTSVKIIVEKDYSWPSIRSSSSSVREDKMVFTCETKCTIEEILISVLSFFLDPAQVELHNGCLPVDEYGLKIFGLDEFLLNSSQLGENPFVGQALMFGKDIRLEVGRTTARPYKITEHHEMWNINMSPASRLEKDQQHQKPSLKVSAESVERVIDVIKKEIKTSSTQFMHINTMKYRQAVKQSVKLLCTLLGKLMTYELIEALNIYTLATTMEQFETGTQMLIMAIHKFIGIYAESTQSRFDVAPLNKDIAAVKTKRRREVVSVDERLLIKVESIHNLCDSWQLRTFGVCIVVSVMHGSSELCTGFKDIMRPIDFDSAFFVYSHIDTWAAFDLPLCVLPRETRVVIVVYGLNRGADSGGVGVGVPGGAAVGTVPVAAASATNQLQINSATSPSVASSSSIGTNNTSESGNESCESNENDRIFRQGSIFVPLTLLEDRVVQPWGPRPLFENCNESTILVTLPEFEYDVVFPYVGFGERSTKREFETLDEGTQQYLLDIVEGGVTHCLTQCEMELLWEKRHYLTHMPSALPLVLISSVGWDWASLNNIYQLLDDWMPLSPIQAIELLLPNFPDMIIRERAITWLKGASSAFIFNFLPQLVEALRFETFENSSLAAYLLHLCAQDRRFAFEIYWQLQQRVDHCVEVTLRKRYMTMQEQIFNIMDNLFVNEIHNQHLLLRSLDGIGADMAETNDHNKMYSILQRHLALLDAHILENNIRLPILPSFLCIGIETKESNFFNSLTKPIKICFKGLKTTYSVLYKIGDDMRQDALVLQLVKVMNDIWLSEELDLRMIIFRCMPVGVKKGMIELVPDCQTLREIQSASGATGVFKDDVLKNWLEKHNPNEFQYKIALKNFELSCAGWCVATYVLGIGDRHNDNILVTTTGHVFHIDFGKYMGDWQMAGAFRRLIIDDFGRESSTRTRFRAQPSFRWHPRTEIEPEPPPSSSSQSATTRYQAFVDNCCKAFNLLRKKYSLLMNLMKLISCSNVPGMSMHAVNFVQNNLLLNLSDTEATAQFTRMIQESLASKFPR
ncbi:unnamed protein product [Anisakis simplex]|uniref:phosphatidylinositol 3-kinase n=1 Tax=Anisakis simplex TaxID=6269 RepID=A0A0M3K8T5_ANISI|nr:unnamed protein product [Anisakis simplex]